MKFVAPVPTCLFTPDYAGMSQCLITLMVLVVRHSGVTKGGGHGGHMPPILVRCLPYGNCGIGKTNSNLLPVPPPKNCVPPLVPPHLRVPSYATDLVTIGIASPNVP